MIDWPEITAAGIGAVTAIGAIAGAAIPIYFRLKAQIAENKARLDVHDARSGIPSASIVAGPVLTTEFPPTHGGDRPINPMPAMPASKITTLN